MVTLRNTSIVEILKFKETDLHQKEVCVLPFDVVDKLKREKSAKNKCPFWIDAIDINGLAFVLFGGDIRINKFAWIGREDTFVSNDLFEGVSSLNFPCNSPLFKLHQSVVKLVWIEMDRICRTFWRLLSSSSLHQGRFCQRSDTVHISSTTFSHLCRQGMGYDVSNTIGTTFIIAYEVKDSLQAFSSKQTSATESLHFKGTTGVKTLTKLFDAFAVFGIRQRWSKLTDPMRKLRTNDGVHYLIEREGEVCAKLEYVEDLGVLKISLAYSPFYVPWDKFGRVNNPPTKLRKEMAKYSMNNKDNSPQGTAEEDKTIVLAYGASFEYNDCICQIVSRENVTMVSCIENEGREEFLLHKGVVRELVLAYLE